MQKRKLGEVGIGSRHDHALQDMNEIWGRILSRLNLMMALLAVLKCCAFPRGEFFILDKIWTGRMHFSTSAEDLVREILPVLQGTDPESSEKYASEPSGLSIHAEWNVEIFPLYRISDHPDAISPVGWGLVMKSFRHDLPASGSFRSGASEPIRPSAGSILWNDLPVASGICSFAGLVVVLPEHRRIFVPHEEREPIDVSVLCEPI